MNSPENPSQSAQLPNLEGLKRKYRNALDATEAGRELQALDRSYYDGTGTISDEWKATLRSHKLVSPNINITKNIVNGFLGVVEAQPHDPQAYPRTPAAQGASDIATKALRYACDRADFNSVKSDCVENYFIEGLMAAKIYAEAPHPLARTQINNIRVERIHPDEFFYDPHSREYDFHDALYLGIARWTHVSEIFQQYPDAEKYGDIAPGDLLGETSNRTMRDAPDVWLDRKEKRVRVVEMYYKDRGQWKRIVYCHAGVLDFGDSGYVDGDGLSICPIVAMSCYINLDKDNDSLTHSRFGVVRSMIGPSDEYNCWRGAMIRAVLNRRVQQTDPNALPVDSKIVREEAARPDGVMPPGWNVVGGNQLQEATSMIQLAQNEINRMGPTPAVLGRSLSDSQSGRSRMIQQNAGMTELATLLGRIERWESHVYRHIWFAVRQYWRDEMYVRVSGQSQAPTFLTVNVPTVETRPAPLMGADGQPQLDAMGQPIMKMQTVVTGMENELAEMDVDIVIVPVNDTATLEHDVRQQILELIQAGVAPGTPQFTMMMKLFPFANKIEVMDELKTFMDEQQQAQSAAQQAQAQQVQAAQQVATEQQQAKTANLAAQARKHIADADHQQVETAMLADQLSGMAAFYNGGQASPPY